MSFNEDFLASLTPAELQQLIGGFNDSGFEDFGDYGSPGAFNFSYTGGGSQAQPSVDYFTTKGDINLSDRAQEAGRVNLLQDYGALSVDNILSGYAGGGAYDTGAFTPTYDYGEPLNMKGRRKAESLAGAGGWQGFVTDLIFREQLTPAEAEAKLYETVNAPDDPSLTDAQRAQKQALQDSLKPLAETTSKLPSVQGRGATAVKSPEGGSYNTEAIRQFTTNVWSDLMEDPEFKYQDEATGLYYDKTPEEAMVKTPQMLAYDKFGIPYPTATYDDPKYMEEFTSMAAGGAGPEQRQTEADAWMAQQEQRKRGFEGALGAERESKKVTGALDEAWENRPERAMTEWDAMLDAMRSGEDQLAARDAFRAGGAPAAPQGLGPVRGGRALQPEGIGAPQAGAQISNMLRAGGQDVGPVDRDQASEMLAEMYRSQGGLSGGAGPGFDFDGGPQAIGVQGSPLGQRMVRDAPWVVEDRQGNVTPFDFARPDTSAISQVFGGAGLAGRSGLPTGRRATEEDITKQRAKTKAATGKRSQAANQVFQATYGDPRLAQVEAMGRAYALAQAGQTPFRDAMQVRNANARRMLSGA